MKLLLDENVPNKIKTSLIKLGMKETIHINDIDKGIPDKEVFELAQKEQRIIITGDDDFKAEHFKYKIPIIWITPKERQNGNVPQLIKWILDNFNNYNIKIEYAFISIRKDKYVIEYKNKSGVFGKIKTKEISYKNIKITSDKP